MIRKILILVAALPLACPAATFNATGSWSNIPWGSMNPGDVCFVSGITGGSLSVSKSGEAGKLIWIVCRDGSATSGSLSLANREYIGLVGISFTGTISLSNTVGCKIIDCERIGGSDGVAFSVSNSSDFNLVRGMKLTGLSPSGNIFSVSGNNNVIEYCKSEAGGDFVRIFGNFNVVRNNYLGPRTADTTNHVDDIQSYEQATSAPNWTINNLWEANFSNTNSSNDAHGYIIQDTSSSLTLAGGLLRGNIHYNLGRNVGEWNNWPDVYSYNNTYIDAWDVATSWADFAVWIRGTSSGHVWGNNAFIRCTTNSQGSPFELGGSGTGTILFNNLSYLSGNLTSGGGNINSGTLPFEIDANLNYAPGVSSPLRNAARYLTKASGAGSNSTSITVDDARFFCDGWGVTEGDLIKIGDTSSPVRIVKISGNTLTLASARTWPSGAPISVSGWDSEIGALPYRTDGLAVNGSISNTGSEYSVAVQDPSIVRMVVFYENGVPANPDYDFPFTHTSSTGIVTAKIYSRYASQDGVTDAAPWVGAAPDGKGDNLNIVGAP